MNYLSDLRTLIGILLMAVAGSCFSAESAARVPEGYVNHLAELINDYRAHLGLEPLAFSEDLVTLASEHSSSMAEQRQLSHDGFRVRFSRASSKICVENVGRNFATPEALLEGWRLSPTHDVNLLEPKVSRMGIAVTAKYVTFFACALPLPSSRLRS